MKLWNKEELLDLKFPTGKYSLIYGDPPWSYWNGGKKSADRHYPTMDIEDIKNLPVEQISQPDSILALWATYPILPQALDVVKAWGFEYSTVLFTWVKRNKVSNSYFWGCGSYTRANAEIVLLGKKGKGIPRKRKDIHQIIDSQISVHSRKPDIVRTKLVQLFGDVPRVELFARTKIHGWEVWGNNQKLEYSPLESFTTDSQGLINKELLLP